MTQEPQQDKRATRRGVLLGVGVAGVGALAGCSTAAVPYDANLSGQAPGAAPMPSAAKSGGAGAMSGGSGAAPTTTGGGTLLGDVSEIPVGGGKVFMTEKVVVTQPVKGEFKAFSAVCTHVGCIVDKVANGKIYCPCHGSIFKITDGSVVAGPAPRPIPAEKINVSTDGKITLQ
jgi:Rieske Fe-S protein